MGRYMREPKLHSGLLDPRRSAAIHPFGIEQVDRSELKRALVKYECVCASYGRRYVYDSRQGHRRLCSRAFVTERTMERMFGQG